MNNLRSLIVKKSQIFYLYEPVTSNPCEIASQIFLFDLSTSKKDEFYHAFFVNGEPVVNDLLIEISENPLVREVQWEEKCAFDCLSCLPFSSWFKLCFSTPRFIKASKHLIKVIEKHKYSLQAENFQAELCFHFHEKKFCPIIKFSKTVN